MEAGFSSFNFDVATSDGRNFTLLEDIIFTASDGSQYKMPKGATSDGASTPPELWVEIPPFGDYWKAAYLHDCAYRGSLQSLDGTPLMLPKDKCDKLLLDAMRICEVGEIIRLSIYEGVAIGGQSAFNSDRGISAPLGYTPAPDLG